MFLLDKLKGGRLSEIYWYIRNLISYSSVDKFPENYLMHNYDEYWNKVLEKGGGGGSYPVFINILEQRINTNVRLLDIGCGNGELLRLLSNKKNIDCIGIDFSERAVNLTKDKGINAEVFDIFKDDFKQLGDFDYITMLEVLEHIPNAEEAMLRIKDAFKSKIAFFSIPNSGSLYDRIRLLRGRFPKQWVVHPSEHVRFWTLNDFKFTLSNLDIKLIKVHAIPHNPSLNKISPSLFSQSFIFEVKL